MTKARLNQLFEKYLDRQLTEAEVVELMTYIRSGATDKELEGLLLGAWENTPEQRIFDRGKSEKLFKQILAAGGKTFL